MNGIETVLERVDALSGRVDRMDERQREDCIAMRRDISDVKVAVGALRVKAGVWGLAGGLIPPILVLVFLMLKLALDGSAIGLAP